MSEQLCDDIVGAGESLPMTFSVEKIDFIKQISPGLITLMTDSCVRGDMGTLSSNESDTTSNNYQLRKNVLEVQQSAVGSFMTTFCNQLFEDCFDRMSYAETHELLTYFDRKGMYLQKVFDEASIPIAHFRGKAKVFALMVQKKELVTFEDLAELHDDDLEYD